MAQFRFMDLEIWKDAIALRGASRGVFYLPADCADLAEGYFTFPQVARSWLRGILPSRWLRGPGRGVFYLPADCADPAEGFFTFPLVARTWPMGILGCQYLFYHF